MGQEKLYIEKELSWLSFNERVLQEAADKSNPLIERMRFLGIYSNNLDEFYKVRFAELKRRIIISEEQGSNSHSRHLLGKIQTRVLKADQEFDGLYNELLLEMARNQIFLINERQLSVNQGGVRYRIRREAEPARVRSGQAAHRYNTRRRACGGKAQAEHLSG